MKIILGELTVDSDKDFIDPLNSASEPLITIRETKKNWVEGKKGPSRGLVIQQQLPEQTLKNGYKISKQFHGQQNKKPLAASLNEALFKMATEAEKNEVDDPLLALVMTRTRALIQAKAKEVPSILSLLAILIQTCKTGVKEDLERYLDIISRFEVADDYSLNHWVKILTSMTENEPLEHFSLLPDVLRGLETHSTLLNSMTAVFSYPPHPDLKQFAAELHKSKKDLKSFIDSFDRDPKAVRAPIYNKYGALIKSTQDILKEQFDTTQLRRLITRMSNKADNVHLTTKQQYDLAQQLTYINAIGKDYPFAIGKKIRTDLTKISRTELRSLSDILIAQVRDPLLNKQIKMKAQLKLLAVMREQYCRSTGQFIDNSQLLSILMALANQQHMLLEMNCETRQNSTSSFFAAVQWVFANGGTVDVCNLSSGLVQQDYIRQGAKNFFTCLGISSTIVEADDPAGTYRVGGINYSTVADLALYRSRAEVEKEDLIAKKSGSQLPANLIINGSNLSALDAGTSFALSSDAESTNNSYTWIYPLVNEFINQKEFRNLDSATGTVWSEEQDLIALKLFLSERAPAESHQQQIQNVSDLKLNVWINSACSAQQLLEDEDFIISQVNNLFSTVVPVFQDEQQHAYIFGDEIQQFLQARLQEKYPFQHFMIEPEKVITATATSKDLFDFYKYHGRILGLFKTFSTNHELMKQSRILNIDRAYRVLPDKRTDTDSSALPEFKNNDDSVRKIKSLMTQAKVDQPVIVFAKDKYQVKQIYNELSQQCAKEGGLIQVRAFTGQESEELRQHWMENKAGIPKTITITTHLLTNQMTFETQDKNGFLVIQTHSDTPSDPRKLLEQVAPDNKAGTYIIIHEDNGAVLSSSWPFQSEQERKNIVDQVGDIQHKKNQEMAIQRYYTQQVFIMQQAVLKQLDDWQALLHLIYPEREWNKLDNELFTQRQQLIAFLNEQWAKCLEDSDPDHIYFNPYIRRDRNKKLQTSALDKTLKIYEHAINDIWQKNRTVLKAKTAARVKEGSVNDMRCQYLEQVQLNEQIQLNKLIERQNEKAKDQESNSINRYLDSGFDIDGAMLTYTDVPKERYRTAFVETQLQSLIKDISKEINSSSLNSNTQSLLIQRLNKVRSFPALEQTLRDYTQFIPPQQFAEKYRMQPIIQEMIRIYNYIGLQETPELQRLRQTFIDNVTFEIIGTMEESLSWAVKENRGLGYWLERTAVKTAALEILSAIELVKKEPDLLDRQIAIKHLYKTLIRHKAGLEELWIFHLGHENTRDLINKTLNTLDSITVIDQLDADFIHECKEEALSDLIIEQTHSVLAQIERKHGLKTNLQWQRIKEQFHLIQQKNNTIYALDELYYFLTKTRKELHYTDSPLFKPVIELRGELRAIWDKLSQKNQGLMSQSRYFEIKAKQIQTELQRIGNPVTHVTINHEQIGFGEYFDLIV